MCARGANMHRQKDRYRGDEGFVLVTALMILLVLTLIGIYMSNQTNTEIQIAGSDKVQKQTFYEADGGTEFAAEILEQNIACIAFKENGAGTTFIGQGPDIALDNSIGVAEASRQLWQNALGKYSGGTTPYPSDSTRDLWIPPAYAAGAPHTNITIEGIADLSPGSSIIFAAGYLGLGRSIAAAGVVMDYEIDSQHIGPANSESLIQIEYRHVVGREDPFCRYD